MHSAPSQYYGRIIVRYSDSHYPVTRSRKDVYRNYAFCSSFFSQARELLTY
jgi:hypothetical protein